MTSITALVVATLGVVFCFEIKSLKQDTPWKMKSRVWTLLKVTPNGTEMSYMVDYNHASVSNVVFVYCSGLFVTIKKGIMQSNVSRFQGSYLACTLQFLFVVWLQDSIWSHYPLNTRNSCNLPSHSVPVGTGAGSICHLCRQTARWKFRRGSHFCLFQEGLVGFLILFYCQG